MVAKEEKRHPDHQYDDYKWDNRDRIVQLPDGSCVIRRVISEQETLLNYHSSGSYMEYRGGQKPESGKAMAGTIVDYASENRCVSTKTGIMATLHNGNNDEKAYGHDRDNYDHDAHITYGKNVSTVIGGDHAQHTQGSSTMNARGEMTLASSKGNINVASARGIHLEAKEGNIMMSSKSAVQIMTPTGSGADIHYNSARKCELISKDDQNFKGEKDWNCAYQGDIDQQNQKDHNVASKQDIFHVIKGDGYHWIGQVEDKQKVGALVMTVAGPAKKAKSFVG